MTADLEKINGYSIALTEKICNEVFSGKEKITGDEIRNLLPVQQVNVFVLKGLFARWREEMARLKSPYFNYETEEVKGALANLMNKLSNNISVSREFFRPLLVKAIEDTLILATNPLQVFEREWRPGEVVTVSSIEEKEKFYKINSQYLNLLKHNLKNAGKASVSKEEALNIIKEAPIEPEDSTSVFEKLSQLLQIEVNSIRLSPSLEQAPTEFPVTRPETQHTAPEPPSFDEGIKLAPPPPPAPSVISQPPAEEPLPLYQKFAGNKEPEQPTGPKTKVSDLKAEISLSQRFLFINSLFQGNDQEYNLALEQIEKSNDAVTAKHFLHENYAVKYNWNYGEHEVQEFMDLIDRRFF